MSSLHHVDDLQILQRQSVVDGLALAIGPCQAQIADASEPAHRRTVATSLAGDDRLTRPRRNNQHGVTARLLSSLNAQRTVLLFISCEIERVTPSRNGTQRQFSCGFPRIAGA